MEKLCRKLKYKDEVSIKRHVDMKFNSFLSRKIYNVLCKIQQTTYDTENESYRKNRMSYGDYKLEMQTKLIFNTSLL